MNNPERDLRDRGPDRRPYPLDYSRRKAAKPPQEIGEPLEWGCIYAFVAMITSGVIIGRLTDDANALGFAWAVVLGGPLLIAIFIKRWRFFALGILIMTGVIYLILGTCGEIVSKALRNR